MTVIRPNSIAGITSLTALGTAIDFYNVNGTGIAFNNVNLNNTSGISTFSSINFTGTLNQNGSPFVASRWTAGTGNDIYRLSGNVGVGTTNPSQKLDVNGTISISDGVYMMSSTISTNVTVPVGRNALMIGPITVGTGYTVTIESGSTLVVV